MIGSQDGGEQAIVFVDNSTASLASIKIWVRRCDGITLTALLATSAGRFRPLGSLSLTC
jgi:hypothetical protein